MKQVLAILHSRQAFFLPTGHARFTLLYFEYFDYGAQESQVQDCRSVSADREVPLTRCDHSPADLSLDSLWLLLFAHGHRCRLKGTVCQSAQTHWPSAHFGGVIFYGAFTDFAIDSLD